MGVRGLTSYIEGNKKQFYEERKLKNTKLVIDGNSLLCNFHVKSGLDQRHGGDYESFANIIQQFFDALTTCNIEPFVVMDGAIDYSGKKFPTLKERVQGRIELASKMSSGKARQSQVSPFTLLSRAVFRQKLSSLNVPFIYCMFEADQEVACLANKWNCAVLSKDSDFYIFDLKGGYLPYEFFEWHNISMCQETKERYIPVSHFSINNFCACFNNMNKELLPLFAVIVGNDYTSPRSMDAFFSRVNFSQVAQPAHWWMHARIDGLLHWLSQFPGPEEAMDEVLVRDSAQDITQDIISGMQEYKVSHSNLAQYFMHGASVDNLAKYYTPANLPEPVRHLPEWLLDRLSRGHLPSFILDVLVLQKTILGVQVENCQLPSSHTTSLPIRQVFYGLLLDGNRKLLQGQGSEQGETTNPTEGSPLYHVQEFDRQGLKFQGASIDAILPSGIQQLPLEKLNEVLLETLGADESITIADRPHLNLPVCVTCYWLSSSKPKPNLQMVQALLLGIVYGELCRLGGSQRGPAAEYPGVRAVCNRLGRLRVRANERRGPDLDVAHAYSQWQSCLWMSIYLNQLLCCPLPEPECAWLYSGTFVHGAVVEMKWGSTPEDLLMGAPFPAQLYRDIQVAVQRSVGADFFRPPSRKWVNASLDQRHGGDYESFANIIQQFFETLTTCNIKPFVVMDGAIDYSGKKFPTLKERAQGRVEDAGKISTGKSKQSQVSPFTLLSRTVFRQKLASLNVPFIHCMFEADQEIACLANEWNCAVLSKDSDFYIFDLKGGRVLLETLGADESITIADRPHLNLPVCVTCYWLSSSKPKPNLQMVQALLLGIVYGELCRLGGSQRDQLRDQFVFGISSKELRRKLLNAASDNELTWPKMIQITNNFECTSIGLQSIQRGPSSPHLRADHVGLQQRGAKQREFRMGRTEPRSNTGSECHRCLGKGHAPGDRRFKEFHCRGCGKTGHLERACKTKHPDLHATAKEQQRRQTGGSASRSFHSRSGPEVNFVDKTESTTEGPVAEYPGVRAVCNRLGRLRVRANERRGPDLDVAHAYSQWQSCLWMSIYLNQLLCSPLPEPECAWLYGGTFVHGAVKEMKGGSTPEVLLTGAPFPAQLYSAIQGAMWHSVGADFFAPSSTKKRRGRRPNKRGRAPRAQGVVNRFALLTCEDDDADEE
ncbi:protein asteroid homolog 1-like [Conger conger]|uniref:protein asteroid homolog 1-like n=1 Tax=Conger conger TaxID=82655 RepID=UPI002A59D401|nr:protein asteroid homolog 1-like [Conger conger]